MGEKIKMHRLLEGAAEGRRGHLGSPGLRWEDIIVVVIEGIRWGIIGCIGLA
jgi:hypothetical protein